MEHLRKQYLKRAPEGNVLGTEEEPVDWATLGLSQKVGLRRVAPLSLRTTTMAWRRKAAVNTSQVNILWELCEWQMVDPARFRGLLKSEDEAASWVSTIICAAAQTFADRHSGWSLSGGTRLATLTSCLTVSRRMIAQLPTSWTFVHVIIRGVLSETPR